MSSLSASVGKNGVNRKADVTTVQQLLKQRGFDPGKVDGLCGTQTITAIMKFQQGFMRQPDGLMQVDGLTWQKLSSASPTAAISTDWSGDSARWPQEKKLRSLNPIFRVQVERVLTSLRGRGFRPKIFYGWRSVAVQEELVKLGRSKVRFSFHNAQCPDGTPNGYAVDIVDERWGWSKDAETNGFWTALGEEAKKLALVWGGDWTSFKDVAHVQGRKNSELVSVKGESGL